jgi:hypothetical protein
MSDDDETTAGVIVTDALLGKVECGRNGIRWSRSAMS